MCSELPLVHVRTVGECGCKRRGWLEVSAVVGWLKTNASAKGKLHVVSACYTCHDNAQTAAVPPQASSWPGALGQMHLRGPICLLCSACYACHDNAQTAAVPPRALSQPACPWVFNAAHSTAGHPAPHGWVDHTFTLV